MFLLFKVLISKLKDNKVQSYLQPTVKCLSLSRISIILLALIVASCNGNKLRAPDTTQQPVVESVIEREKGTGSPGGIPNLGATCYMNSVLQILKSFYLVKIKEKDDELGKPIQALMQVIADDKQVANKAEATAVFNALSTQFNWTTIPTKQEDAEELLSQFFNWMKLPQATTQYVKFYTAGEEEPSGSSSWLLHQVELSTDNMALVALPTMQDLFDHSLNSELITDAKFRHTDTCNSNFERAPRLDDLDNLYQQIFVVQLKRYATKGGIRLEDGSMAEAYEAHRIDTDVEQPMYLTIQASHTVKKDRNYDYSLVAFIWQRGNLHSGHYVAYVKKEDGWTCYNDDHVEIVTDAEANDKAKQAYLFFYQPNRLKRAP